MLDLARWPRYVSKHAVGRDQEFAGVQRAASIDQPDRTGAVQGALAVHICYGEKEEMNLRMVHRASALVLIIYATLHIANHLIGMAGVEAHRAALESLRILYRAPPIETLLLASVVLQIVTGVWSFVAGARTRRGSIAWLQASSGLLLGCYLAVHVTAVLVGRHQLQLDTDLYYAAAGVQVPQTQGFFAPYYFVGVFSLFIHLGCALHRLRQRHRGAARSPSALKTIGGCSVVGATIALLLVLLLAGKITPIDVPENYLATFDQFK